MEDSEAEGAAPGRPVRPNPWLVLDLGLVLIALFQGSRVLATWWARNAYPFDLEWMEGGMLVHAWRLREGLPIYTAPSADWIPFLYPPGYSAVVAGLSLVTGEVTPGLARAVSASGSLAAALAVVYAGARFGRSVVGGVLGGVVFLLTFPESGAFFDLVRPDGLGTGLLAWSLVLGLERDRRATAASGLLLALAFTVKHNLAAFGLPLLLGILVDRGWRRALLFAVTSVVPALAFLAGMQAATGGHFLTWLLEVAGAHPLVMARWFPGTMVDVGEDLPWIVLGAWAAAFGGTLAAIRRSEHRLVVVVVALLFGGVSLAIGSDLEAVYGWFGEHPRGLARVARRFGFGARSLYLVQGMAVGTVLAAGVAWVRERRVPEGWTLGMGVAAVAWVLGGLMRAHHGGFLNVYIPIHLVIALAAGVGFGKVRSRWPSAPVAVLSLLPFAIHLWGTRHFDVDRFVPTVADAQAGWQFVEALEACDSPVLAPIDPWLAVLAGHEPSWHLMALWDIDHPAGPYVDAVPAVRDAVRERRWSCIVVPQRDLRYGIPDHYRPSVVPTFPPREPGRLGPGTLAPRTGWRDRPNAIWTPRP